MKNLLIVLAGMAAGTFYLIIFILSSFIPYFTIAEGGGALPYIFSKLHIVFAFLFIILSREDEGALKFALRCSIVLSICAVAALFFRILEVLNPSLISVIIGPDLSTISLIVCVPYFILGRYLFAVVPFAFLGLSMYYWRKLKSA